MTRGNVTLATTLTVAWITQSLFAQNTPPPAESPGVDAETDAAATPPPPLDGSRFLTGDWNGARADLFDRGISFDLQWTQVAQGVVSGGDSPGWKYGGLLDYLVSFDLGKMDVLPGGLVRVFAQSRYGKTVNGQTGAALPENTAMFFPLTGEIDESIPITLSELSYTQFLSPQIAFTLGKLQTLDGDPNEFASGRGRSQFMNLSFVAPNLVGLAVPYSTLGGGVLVFPTPNIGITSLVISSNDSSTTTGFEQIGEGTTWFTEARFQYKLGELPGGQNVGFAYAFDQEFRAFNRPGLPGGQGASFEDDTWTLYWSMWQYIYTPDPIPALINPGDGRQDLRGLGLFMRAGIVDESTNVARWGINGGIGGRGLIPSREEDSFGFGVGYVSFSDKLPPVLNAALENEAVGFEAYYNAYIAPGVNLTGDVQVFSPTRRDIDTTVVLGVRMNIAF